MFEFGAHVIPFYVCRSLNLVPPMLSIPNQLEAAYQGQDVTLECQTEAYPASINYWTTEKGDMIISGKLIVLTRFSISIINCNCNRHSYLSSQFGI